MHEPRVHICRWLYPLAWLYGLVAWIRNKCFDWGLLRSRSFHAPVIGVGNLAVGGTGKTPHTEYLIRLLQDSYRVAVLSRGYKRKTKSFVLADANSTAATIGDEPYQMKQKYPETVVAVDGKRSRGIGRLLSLREPFVDVVLLDDAFQHRYVKPGLNILLTDYHRLFCDDTLLPAGRLRESMAGKDRAQIVVVTKCPADMKPIEYNIIAKRMALFPYQWLYFSTLRYGNLQPAFPDAEGGGAPLSPVGTIERKGSLIADRHCPSP